MQELQDVSRMTYGVGVYRWGEKVGDDDPMYRAARTS
jgi:hypothetical protein